MNFSMRFITIRYICVFIAAIAVAVFTQKHYYKGNSMFEFANQTAHLQKLFTKTKILCFGRYAITVPAEAQLISGNYGFPSKISSYYVGEVPVQEKLNEKIDEIKRRDKDAEIIYSGTGPVESSWQLRYFDSDAAKELGLIFFDTYIKRGDFIFHLGNTANSSRTTSQTDQIEMQRAKSLRLRREEDIPSDDGYCIENAFMANSFYDEQETVNIGIFLPSFPDITFFFSSNKNAYSDYTKDDFEKMKTTDLSLLGRIHTAQEQQGISYPPRTILRQGKRDLHHWKGEESLIKRPDGVHDFEWGFVGTPKDVARPAEIIIGMFTKVDHNVVGAAKVASVSDEEAVALWDKLVAGIKFRVAVPGAPEGSYYILNNKWAARANDNIQNPANKN